MQFVPTSEVVASPSVLSVKLQTAANSTSDHRGAMGWWPSSSSTQNSTPQTSNDSAPNAAADKPKKKICCACPDTKVRSTHDVVCHTCYGLLQHFHNALCSSETRRKSSRFSSSMQRLRDECIAMHTEDNPYCKALIEAHLACLRMEGFNVSPRASRVIDYGGIIASLMTLHEVNSKSPSDVCSGYPCLIR